MSDVAPEIETSEHTESSQLAPGDIVAGKYRIDGFLGAGGMGVVLSATHLELNAPVAIKVVRDELADNEQIVSQLLFEARAVARMRSSHIVRVLDVARLDSGAPYIVMEQLQGWDLQTVLEERGALPMREAIQHILQACEGLAEAHGLGIVHRDLKPENLYLATTPEGAVLKILDFGISKDIAPSIQPGRCSTLTKDGSAVGSPYYMSPEQMRASPSLDARADIWSLGAILFELLTGQCPFEADTPAQLCTKVLVDDAPSLRELLDRAPVELDEIVRRCLQKDPRARFQTVTELADALRELIASTERAATERAAAERAATERAATERAATERFDLASLTVDSERKPSSGPQSGARHPLEAALAEPTPTNFTPVRLSSAGLPRRRHAAWVAASAVLAIAVVACFELRGAWVTPEWLTGRHANVAALAPKVAPPPADELNQQAQPRPVVSVVVSPPPSATVAEIAPTTETKVIAATPARPSATHPASAPQRSPQGPKYYIPPVRREPSQREPEPTPASPAPDNPETRYGL